MTDEFDNFDFMNPFHCHDCFDLTRYLWRNSKAKHRGRTEEEHDAYLEVATIFTYHHLTHAIEMVK